MKDHFASHNPGHGLALPLLGYFGFTTAAVYDAGELAQAFSDFALRPMKHRATDKLTCAIRLCAVAVLLLAGLLLVAPRVARADAVPAPVYQGTHDKVTCEVISGW